ncbi:RHS repeat-associated core domain-containing protein, partial [Streptomyces sp. NPDC057909]|uniref:RHS repeat-associated core domain-containing protein n=1 Tax=Streptomyces sp. NPDC057909 TaxID=3346277 RepID=UPI0036E81C56
MPAAEVGLGPKTFTEETRDGLVRTYTAFTADQVKAGVNLAPVAPMEGDVTTAAKRVVWLETSEVDHSGNTMEFTYKQVSGTGTFNPDEIHYTSNTSHGNTAGAKRYVKFEYDGPQRTDVVQHFQAGVSYKQTQRLTGVSMWAPNPADTEQVWRYNLGYRYSSTGQSLLTSVERCDKDSKGCTRQKKFDWYDRAAEPTFTAASHTLTNSSAIGGASGKVADYNGDGVDDLLYAYDDGGLAPPELRIGSRPTPGGKAPLEGKFATPFSSDHFSDGRPLDLEADSKFEFAPATSSGSTDKVYRWNTASGVFEDTGKTVPGEHSDFGDVDGDGRMDLIGDDAALFGHDMTFRLNNGNGFDSYVRSTFAGGPQTSGAGQGEWCYLRVLDTNGDARAELVGNELVGGVCSSDTSVLRTDDGTSTVKTAGTTHVGGVAYQHVIPNELTGDFNGDNLTDALYKGTTVLFNTGAGLKVADYQSGISHNVSYANTKTVDVNGDGMDDIVEFTSGGSVIHYSKGNGSFYDSAVAGCAALCNIGDFNGDGLPDLVGAYGTTLTLRTQDAITDGVQNQLKSVQDGGTNWVDETVSYAPMWTDHAEHLGDYPASYPLVSVHRAMTVVRRVDSRSHNVEQATTSASARSVYYTYLDPVRDLRGRNFLGFGTVQTWEPAQPRETVALYPHRQATDGTFYPSAGSPSVVTTTVPILTQAQRDDHPATAKARVTSTTYTPEILKPEPGASHTVYAVLNHSTATRQWEQTDASKLVKLDWSASPPGDQHITNVVQPATLARETVETAEHQAEANGKQYGNLTKDTVVTTGGTTTETVYGYDNRDSYDTATTTADWLIGLPTTTAVTSKEADHDPADVTRHTENRYDSAGRLDRIYIEKDNTHQDVRVTTANTYDTMGALTKVTVTPGDPSLPVHESHIEYTPLDATWPNEEMYPSQLWEQHAVAAYRPSAWMMIHPAYGVPIATEDVNGVKTTTTYDTFGRALKLTADGQADTTVSYAPRPDSGAGTVGTTITTSHNGITTKASTDALGRIIGGSSTGFDGTTSTSSTWYDMLGRVVTTSGLGATSGTQYLYDALNRLVKTTVPGGKNYTYAHTFDTDTTTDPDGHTTTVTRDVDGRTVSSVATLVNPDKTTTPVTTSYQYGPFGLTSKVIDDKNNITSMGYDELGRRTQLDDPDKGITTTAYNGFGQVRTDTHQQSGHSTSFDYDDEGRKISSTSEDGTSTFVWDTADHGIGQLEHATSPDQIKTGFRYDGYGRAAGTDTTDQATGDVYATDNTYDTSGRPDTFTYPSSGSKRLTLSTAYNSHGYPSTISDITDSQHPKALWTVNSRKPTGALDTATMNSGTGAITLTDTYQNLTDLLQGIKATNSTGTSLLDLAYSYYDNGLVKTRTQTAPHTRTEAYTYDTLGRLTDSQLDSGNTSQHTGYGYDTLGNQTSVSSTGTNGTYTDTRTFGQTGSNPQPHTLATQNATGTNGPVQGNESYEYDNQGRQTKVKTSSDTVTRQVTYTAFDLPKTVTKDGHTTTFKYNAFGQRVKETGPTGTTFSLPGLFEKRTTNAGTKYIHYLHGTDGTFGQAVTIGDITTFEYQPTDALGSIGVTTTATGSNPAAVTGALYYDPYGNRITKDGKPYNTAVFGTGNTTHGFTGQEHDDDLGLINFNGRMYDSAQSDFLTPDPIISNPLDGQAWNPYSYVRNSPLNNIDPTGFVSCDFVQVGACEQYGGAIGGGPADRNDPWAQACKGCIPVGGQPTPDNQDTNTSDKSGVNEPAPKWDN